MFIRHNKIQGDALSVSKGTCLVYASSQNSLDRVKEGSYLRVGFENAFYIINKKEEFFYLKPFVVKDNFTLEIAENVVPKLQPNDVISLSFKESEMSIVAGIVNAGTNYKVNDVLIVEGGHPSVDLSNGQLRKTEFTVNAVGENGTITRIGIKYRGQYIEPPDSDCELSGGCGSGAKFALSFENLKNLTTIERKIQSIDIVEGSSVIKMTMPVPSHLTAGNFSCKKWLLILTTNYLSEDKVGVPYSISCDFTPVLQLALMVPNSFTADVVHNQSMVKLEEEILKLHARIDELTRLHGS